MTRGTEFILSAKKIIKRDMVLSCACFLAVASSMVVTPKLEYIDFYVLGMLLALMLVVAGFRELNVLEYLAGQLFKLCHSRREVTLGLIALPFFTSMLITNDVALLIFVPLALTVGRSCRLDMIRVVIWQTLAANLGSAFTPMGNPQNLFIYAHYHMETGSFLLALLPLTLLAAIWLLMLVHSVPEQRLQLSLPRVQLGDRESIGLYLLLLLVCLAAVLRLIDYLWCVSLVVVAIAALDYRLFKRVDYSLLITFIAFFIFIGNLAHMEMVQGLTALLEGGRGRVYLAGILLSQLVSNVPATMLLAGFTGEARELLLGVDVGGLGTLIASMASVISYKLFASEYPHLTPSYLRMFLFYNFTGLVALGLLVWAIEYLVG